MEKLRQALLYLLRSYPNERAEDLSKARINKLLYLADWRHALLHNGEAITGINWYFDHHGPFVFDVQRALEQYSDDFRKIQTETVFSNKKTVYALNRAVDSSEIQLSEDEKDAIDLAVERTEHLSFSKLIQLVYSTYPVVSSRKYTPLDLKTKAAEFVAQA